MKKLREQTWRNRVMNRMVADPVAEDRAKKTRK
jgi:hypothetical protein